MLYLELLKLSIIPISKELHILIKNLATEKSYKGIILFICAE